MLKLGTFKVDCTPPEGCPIGFGVDGSSATVRDPLYMRGFVFDNGETRCLVASLDFCGLMNSAYDDLVRALAQAIDTPADHVVVHCVHQHDTPLLNFEIEGYLKRETFPRSWWGEVIDRRAGAAGGCLGLMQEVAEAGHCETRLYGFASNRRILGADGKVRAMRFSRCGDPDLKAEPVGVIDPMLRTLAFKNASGEIIGSMSFYATHPQVSNGRSMYSADAQGEAMRIIEMETESGLPAFFSGPFGNVTAGKYSSHTDLEGNLVRFGRRLAEGISLNLNGMAWEAPDTFEWVADSLPFPREALDREAILEALNDGNTPEGQKVIKAAVLSSFDYEANASYPLFLLKVGSNRVLFLSGEPFVEYQLFVQSLIPDEFIAIAANCSDNFLYLPLTRNFPEKGYEVTSFRWCTEEFEQRFKDHVARVVL